ncbi:hypothetical protein [Nocardioides soli]|uniref:Phage protein D n=1 Tax=Nocardioides soli TaxID=1036020 RepID=A0A7W4VZG7_9ACTN|nr:hypothetical protein [Nocardioides soli]MBB3044545.1 phage protein D [Nocardioides soli]
MLRPGYRITIGDHVVDTTAEPRASTAVELTVRLDMDTPVDSVTLVQGQVGGLRAQPGDDVSVELGYADEDDGLVRVLTGTVVTTGPGIRTERIVGHSTADALLRTFVDRTFEDTTAGEIVRTLAQEAGVDVDRAEDGPSLPAYVVDGRRNGLRHVRDLACLSGFDTYVTPAGALVFEPFTGSRDVHTVKYGEHVLGAEQWRARPRAGTVVVFGESPGSSRGDESWAWLTQDFTPRRGSAGSGAPTLLVERPVARSAQVAQAAARGIADALVASSLRVRVRLQGRPQVKLGDLLRLERFPAKAAVDRLDGNYQVRGVQHRITKTDGLLTDVTLRGLAGPAAGIGAGLPTGGTP